MAASSILNGPTDLPQVDRAQLVEDVRRALYAAKICSYAQGMNLIKEVGGVYVCLCVMMGVAFRGQELLCCSLALVPTAWYSFMLRSCHAFSEESSQSSLLPQHPSTCTGAILCGPYPSLPTHHHFISPPPCNSTDAPQAAIQKNWSINLGETARIWKGGCIIRAKFLDRIKVRKGESRMKMVWQQQRQMEFRRE